MNPIIAQVCQHRAIQPAQFFSEQKAAEVVAARCDAIRRLKNSGLNAPQIAGETKLHVQTVYYWLSPRRREAMRKKSEDSFRLRHIGGKRQTPAQRQEILTAYLEDPSRGTALACSRGLHPLYAYKLAHALGVLPRKGEQ
jgi:hypothetical protein